MSGGGMLGNLINHNPTQAGWGQQAGMVGPGLGQLSNPSWITHTTQGQTLANQMAAQQMMNQYNRALSPQWMINGRAMSIEAFGREMFGEDTPELTMFLLKYQDIPGEK